MQSEITGYDFNHVFKLDARNDMINYTKDSVPMSANDTVYITLLPKVKVAGLATSHGDLFACDPVFPNNKALGDSMRIFALDHFDAAHPAGSDVSGMFRIFMPEYQDTGHISVKQYISLSGFRLLNSWTSQITLALVEKPVSGAIRFKVVVYNQSVSNGTAMELPAIKFF